jgi:hypothetical protein
MSHGEDARGPWNKGKGRWEKGEQWEYVEDPVLQVKENVGQTQKTMEGHERDEKTTKKLEKDLAVEHSAEVKAPPGELAWSAFDGNS